MEQKRGPHMERTVGEGRNRRESVGISRLEDLFALRKSGFRLGMLMYGKEPTWAEVRRWALNR
jgi:hypothetical protein